MGHDVPGAQAAQRTCVAAGILAWGVVQLEKEYPMLSAMHPRGTCTQCPRPPQVPLLTLTCCRPPTRCGPTAPRLRATSAPRPPRGLGPAPGPPLSIRTTGPPPQLAVRASPVIVGLPSRGGREGDVGVGAWGRGVDWRGNSSNLLIQRPGEGEGGIAQECHPHVLVGGPRLRPEVGWG